MKDREKSFVSAVIYVHNDERGVGGFLDMVIRVLEENFDHSEIICVDDRSGDGSLREIKDASAAARSTSVSVLNMSRFHGIERAMGAGVDLSIGDLVFEFVNELKLFREQPVNIGEAHLYESRANTLLLQGKREQAKSWYEKVIDVYRREYQNENHPLLACPYVNIAVLYMENSEFDEAKAWMEKAESILEESDFRHHEVLTQIYYRHAMLEYRQGQYEMSYQLFRHSVMENLFSVDVKRKKNIEVRGYLMMACSKMGLKEWEAAKNLLEGIVLEKSFEAEQKENAYLLLNVFDDFRKRIEQGEKIETLVTISG